MSPALDIEVAASPCMWGVDFADAPENPPWQTFLDEAVEAGYPLIEAGPVGYLPEDPQRLARELSRRGLGMAGGFMFAWLWRPDRREEDLDVARRTAAVLGGAGGSHVIVVPALEPERTATAGDAELARRLAPRDLRRLVEGLEQVARLVRDEHGLGTLLHPHAGTFVEHGDEIEAVLAAVDPGLVGLCADLGHLAYAGLDPIATYRRYADRCAYIHLKDVDAAIRSRVIAEGIGFEEAVSQDVFCPLERGVTDFEELRDALIETHFSGRLTVEQDLDPTLRASAAANARANLAYLRSIGLVAPAN